MKKKVLDHTIQQCIFCKKTYPLDMVKYRCDCGELLDYRYDYSLLKEELGLNRFKDNILTGVWRYQDLLPIKEDSRIISIKEGDTPLYKLNNIGKQLGCQELYAKFEGTNATGSFKDRGMTVGITRAIELGMHTVSCASTGNTAASLAAYAAAAGLHCKVILPKGTVSKGKLGQALIYGAEVISIDGSFTDAFNYAEDFCKQEGVYFLNSINPIRIEGQKTVAFEICEEFDWQPPDYIVLPVGNAGNISAAYKGFYELTQVGITTKIPKMIGIQPETCMPLVKAFKEKKDRIEPVINPKTIATALQCGSPVSWRKALEALKESDGDAEEVSDQEIIDAQKELARKEGILCEPASACSLAGFKKLIEEGRIKKDKKIVLILTGTGLKDPDELVEISKNEKAIHEVKLSELKDFLLKTIS